MSGEMVKNRKHVFGKCFLLEHAFFRFWVDFGGFWAPVGDPDFVQNRSGTALGKLTANFFHFLDQKMLNRASAGLHDPILVAFKFISG